MPDRNKLVVFQLDSCDYKFLQENIEHLPNIKRLFGGKLEPLRTDQFAGSTNTSFNTAKQATHHGVYFQLQWDPETMKLRSLDPDWIGELDPFWRTGKFSEKRGIVLDPSFTFSGDSSPQLEIIGWSPHSSLVPFECNDATLRQMIKSKFGVNPIGNETQLDRGIEARSKERDALIRSARLRGALLRDLVQQRNWDFLYAVFSEPHRAGHVLWPKQGITPPGGLLDVYKAVDEGLGAVLEVLPENSDIIIFAVQGMAHQSTQGHLCRPLMEAALASLGYDTDKFRSRANPIAWLRKTIPARLQWEIRHRIPLRMRDLIIARQYVGSIIPDETIAFPLQSDNHGYWRFLVKGRDASGTLNQDEAEKLREDFGRILSQYKTSDGAPLVREVLFPSTESGPRAHLLPDVVAAWNPDIVPVSQAFHPTAGQVTGAPDTARTGNHRFHAFFGHSGPSAIDSMRPRHVADLPTLLHELLE